MVTPYDSVTVYSNAVCTLPLKSFWRTVAVVFAAPGTSAVELRYSTQMGNHPWAHNADGRKVYTVEVSPASATHRAAASPASHPRAASSVPAGSRIAR